MGRGHCVFRHAPEVRIRGGGGGNPTTQVDRFGYCIEDLCIGEGAALLWIFGVIATWITSVWASQHISWPTWSNTSDDTVPHPKPYPSVPSQAKPNKSTQAAAGNPEDPNKKPKEKDSQQNPQANSARYSSGKTHAELEQLSQTGDRAIGSQGQTRAGQELDKHYMDVGMPKPTGSASAKAAQGRQLLDEILFDPKTVSRSATGGNWPSGTIYIRPDGTGALFDSSGNFQYFGRFTP